MPIPSACQPIQNEIDALEQERQEAWADVQQALDDGDARAKWAAAARAAALTRQLQARADALEACVVDNGGPVPLAAIFAGACTFTGSHQDLVDRGPFNVPLRLGLWFDALRTKVIINPHRQRSERRHNHPRLQPGQAIAESVLVSEPAIGDRQFRIVQSEGGQLLGIVVAAVGRAAGAHVDHQGHVSLG